MRSWLLSVVFVSYTAKIKKISFVHAASVDRHHSKRFFVSICQDIMAWRMWCLVNADYKAKPTEPNSLDYAKCIRSSWMRDECPRIHTDFTVHCSELHTFEIINKLTTVMVAELFDSANYWNIPIDFPIGWSDLVEPNGSDNSRWMVRPVHRWRFTDWYFAELRAIISISLYRVLTANKLVEQLEYDKSITPMRPVNLLLSFAARYYERWFLSWHCPFFLADSTDLLDFKQRYDRSAACFRYNELILRHCCADSMKNVFFIRYQLYFIDPNKWHMKKQKHQQPPKDFR